MDTAHPTAGWEQLGERFYRKIQLYTQVFDQDLDLDHFHVAGAPYGGAIGECYSNLAPEPFIRFDSATLMERQHCTATTIS